MPCSLLTAGGAGSHPGRETVGHVGSAAGPGRVFVENLTAARRLSTSVAHMPRFVEDPARTREFATKCGGV
jgi:hypothetical protein